MKNNFTINRKGRARKRKGHVQYEQVSVSQLAVRLGITRQGVRKAIVEGRIKPAKKIGNQWVIEV